jgi:uncharacterized radical SAM superfamily Fe-S cluster-containing enzyme
MKDTAFRSWLRQLWMENCRERDEFNDLPYTQSEYFQRYKHWLRREFRYQNQQVSKP